MTRSDHALLKEYGRGGHAAFRELVERHAGLVFGAAWRVSGDRTIAEEVAQDVFCLLAKKAVLLEAHPSVTAWLHRTAANTAKARRRARRSHDQKLARFAAESETAGVPEDAEKGEADGEIDNAINRLPLDEREAVVLRYLRDLDYPIISAELGITESAARKRVSRGLQRLQRLMRSTATARLSPAAFAVIVPQKLVGAVMAAAPAPIPASALLSFFTLMTQKQTITVAAAAVLAGGLLWTSGNLWQENKRLSRELAAFQAQSSAAPTAPDAAEPESTKGKGPKSAPAAAELASLRAALEAEREKRLAAEKDARAVRDQVARLDQEVVVSFGKVGEIGNTFGSIYTEALALVEEEKKGAINSPENQLRFAKFIEKAGSVSGISKEIIEFEDAPKEGSGFIAAAYGAAFGLSETEQSGVAAFFAKQLEDASQKKFTLSNLPERGSAEFEPWLKQRWDYFNESRAELRALIPENHQASFDQYVEKGGYGFKNLKLKGMPLMFSLGGDPR
ncbi:MAG: sigma-70 family RNA polymerase sigma factor [Verrucomicrobiota bacterium]